MKMKYYLKTFAALAAESVAKNKKFRVGYHFL